MKHKSSYNQIIRNRSSDRSNKSALTNRHSRNSYRNVSSNRNSDTGYREVSSRRSSETAYRDVSSNRSSDTSYRDVSSNRSSDTSYRNVSSGRNTKTIQNNRHKAIVGKSTLYDKIAIDNEGNLKKYIPAKSLRIAKLNHQSHNLHVNRRDSINSELKAYSKRYNVNFATSSSVILDKRLKNKNIKRSIAVEYAISINVEKHKIYTKDVIQNNGLPAVRSNMLPANIVFNYKIIDEPEYEIVDEFVNAKLQKKIDKLESKSDKLNIRAEKIYVKQHKLDNKIAIREHRYHKIRRSFLYKSFQLVKAQIKQVDREQRAIAEADNAGVKAYTDVEKGVIKVIKHATSEKRKIKKLKKESKKLTKKRNNLSKKSNKLEARKTEHKSFLYDKNYAESKVIDKAKARASYKIKLLRKRMLDFRDDLLYKLNPKNIWYAIKDKLSKIVSNIFKNIANALKALVLKILLYGGLALLLLFILGGGLSLIFNTGVTAMNGSTYQASYETITLLEDYFREKEIDLQIKERDTYIDNPDYDEYVFIENGINVYNYLNYYYVITFYCDENIPTKIERKKNELPYEDKLNYETLIRHNLYSLINYLSAKHFDLEKNKVEVYKELNEIFDEMYTYTLSESKVTRTKKETIECCKEVCTTIPGKPYIDSNGQESYEDDTEDCETICEDVEKSIDYEVTILTMELIAIDIDTVLAPRIANFDEEQKLRYDAYKAFQGNFNVFGSPISFDGTNPSNYKPFLSSPYGWRLDPFSSGKAHHNGMDIGLPTGTALLSAINGKVVRTGYDSTGYGKYIEVQCKDTHYKFLYAHCDSILLSTGDEVKKNQVIAKSGNTGRSTGAHLHLEVRDSFNNRINPTICFQ